MSKAYDRVNIFILQKAMTHLKIPAPFITFITNLFTKRTNQIFTYHGTTDPYNVLVGIDQGEVICPLLWCIYYDPLLCYVQSQRNLGYQLSHSWSSSATGPTDQSLSADIPDTAFIDDTTWITSSQSTMESILSIADSFFILNDILINDDKAILLTNDQLPESREAQFNLPYRSLTIKARPVHATERVLGVWITLQRSDKFIIPQIKQEISQVCNTLKYKKVTDKQLLYVFNAVVIPRLEYRSQLVFFSEDLCLTLMAPFRKLFKHKLNLNQCIPNAILSTNLLYNFRSLYEVKVHSMFTNLVCLLNDPNLTGLTTKIRIRQLQSYLHLAQCPLIDWPFTPSTVFKDNIADVLSVLPHFNLSLDCDPSWSNNIQGGVNPIVSTIPHPVYLKSLSSLKCQRVMFVDQLFSSDGLFLITWQDRRLFHPSLTNHVPKWFKLLESLVLSSPNTSRRLLPRWIVPSRPPVFPATIFFQNLRIPYGSWSFHWSAPRQSLIIGKVLKCLNDDVLIEHWAYSPQVLDISPSNQPARFSLCTGCSFNDPLITHPSYFPKRQRSPCALSCKRDTILKVPSYQKQQSFVIFRTSLFQLKDLARYHYHSNLLLPQEEDLPDPFVPQEVSSHLTQRIFANQPCLPQLIQFIKLFRPRSSFTFYTDGSVMNLGSSDIKAGCAWCEINTVVPSTFQTAVAVDWISSLKTELMAVITAIATLPPDCTVSIYTDSKSLIDKFLLIQNSSFSFFEYARPNLKDTYTTLWFVLFSYIQQFNISISFHKVKAHNNNYWNETTDQLAKLACNLASPITSVISNLFSVTLMYNSTAIMTPLRPFLKDITQAQGFHKFVTLRRNLKYRHLDINWLLTSRHLRGDTSNLATTFQSSYYKAKRIKLLLEELPTVHFLQHTMPHIYDHTWCCTWCSDTESFVHVWTCSARLPAQQLVLSSSKQHLIECLSVVCPTATFQHPLLLPIFAHPTWWSFSYHPSQFTFIDFIKGLIPSEFVSCVHNITHNAPLTAEICLNFLHRVFITSQQHLWLPRCSAMIEQEKFHGITRRQKLLRQPQGSNSFSRSAHIDFSTFSSIDDKWPHSLLLIDKMTSFGKHYTLFRWVLTCRSSSYR